MADQRDEILAAAYEQCAVICETAGHVFIPDAKLSGERACGYCRLVMALAPVRPIDMAA